MLLCTILGDVDSELLLYCSVVPMTMKTAPFHFAILLWQAGCLMP